MVTNRRTTMKQWAASFPKMQKVLQKELQGAVRTTAKHSAELMRADSEASPMKYRGNYARAWKARKFYNPLSWEVYNNVANRRTGFFYAPTIESGQPPGIWVPYTDLRKWVRDKLKITPEYLDIETKRIRKGIFLRGIPSNPLFDNRNFHTVRLPRFVNLFGAYCDRAMTRALTKF